MRFWLDRAKPDPPEDRKLALEPYSRLLRARPHPYKARSVGAWRSLVAHLTGGQGVAGSNPVAPTIKTTT